MSPSHRGGQIWAPASSLFEGDSQKQSGAAPRKARKYNRGSFRFAALSVRMTAQNGGQELSSSQLHRPFSAHDNLRGGIGAFIRGIWRLRRNEMVHRKLVIV